MDFVDKYYEMDSETDLYCPTGFLLQRNWVVLIETHNLKQHTDRIDEWNDFELEQARRWNRWARVVDIRFSAENGGTMYLTLCYDNNVLKQISCNQNLAWLVKRDSVHLTDVDLSPEGTILND